eukprot:jgi/Hompol1/1648/HPOL_000822-RA
MLLQAGADPAFADLHGWTPLHVAVSRHHLDVVDVLVRDPRSNVNCQDASGLTPLMNAAAQGSLSLLEYLMDNGSDPSIVNGTNDTAFDIAVYGAHYEFAERLMRAERHWREFLLFVCLPFATICILYL